MEKASDNVFGETFAKFGCKNDLRLAAVRRGSRARQFRRTLTALDNKLTSAKSFKLIVIYSALDSISRCVGARCGVVGGCLTLSLLFLIINFVLPDGGDTMGGWVCVALTGQVETRAWRVLGYVVGFPALCLSRPLAFRRISYLLFYSSTLVHISIPIILFCSGGFDAAEIELLSLGRVHCEPVPAVLDHL